MIVFDATIHLGDVIMTGVLAGTGHVVYKAAKSVTAFLQKVDTFDRRIEDTADVVDLHTDALVRSGWSKGLDLRPVSRKRRKADVEFSG